MKLRVALIVSHPIQHFCPQYVSFAENKDIEFKVFFASMLGFKKYVDPDFKQEISWGNLELDKFEHEFLNGDKVLPAEKNLDAPSLDKALDDFKPALIITYGYFQLLQKRAHKWAIRNKIAIAYIADSERRQHRGLLKEIIKYPWVRWYLSRIDYFLSVGNANEDFYRYHGIKSKQLIRMHFPIDIKYYSVCFEQKEKLRMEIRQENNIREDETVISVVGKLVNWKNQDHLIDAMLRLENEGVYMHLFILGSGPEMKFWQEKAAALKKSKVHFPGFVNIEKLPAYYAASDFYVHPASVEPHSIAISEAINMGCPIIISDRCGSYGETDDVQEGKTGFVFKFGDIAALAEKMKWMIYHPTERKQLAENAHNISVQFQRRSHKEALNELVQLIK